LFLSGQISINPETKYLQDIKDFALVNKIFSFELWFFAFLPVRCLTASACLCRHGRQVLALAGTQTGSFAFLVFIV